MTTMVLGSVIPQRGMTELSTVLLFLSYTYMPKLYRTVAYSIYYATPLISILKNSDIMEVM